SPLLRECARPMGRRHVRRRYKRAERKILVQQWRPAAHRAASPDRTIHPHRPEHAEVRRDDRRSWRVHANVVCGLDTAVGGGRGSAGRLLPGQPAMNRLKTLACALLLTVPMTSNVFAQGRGGGQGRGAPPAPAKPTPRWPDGHVKIGQVEGEPPGLWQTGGVPLARADKPSDFGLFAADMREPTDPFLASKPKLSQIPFQPWAR